MNVLITGGGGQLARALANTTPAGVVPTVLDRKQLDVTDRTALVRSIEHVQPAVLVNAAAYTAVDRAESEPAAARAVNAAAVAGMAAECSRRGICLVHVSTDFVFDGTAGRPYLPDDVPNPLSVYGASKLAGERALAAQPDLDWRVVRTAWVYSSVGRNFMLTMLQLLRQREVVKVVADQVGTPTSAVSLAECVWLVAQADGPRGILHFTDAGVASWYDFAVAIHEEATALGLLGNHRSRVVPIATDEYPTAARRPANSLLDVRATRTALGIVPVHWRTRLREVLKELQA
jgi:dTDP-4-dehydrorhamnose reductase